MAKDHPLRENRTNLVRMTCAVLGFGALAGSYWGIGLVLGPIAFLLANWMTSKEGHLSTDIGGIAGLIGFAISLGVAVPRFGATFQGEDTWIGVGAPDFEMVDIDGNTHRLSDYRGKRVFIAHWGIRCPPCIQEIPDLVALVERMPEDQFQLLGVSADPELWLEEAVEQTDINYPVFSLMTVGNDWGAPYNQVRVLPTLMVVSPDGRFEEIHVGRLSREELFLLAKGTT